MTLAFRQFRSGLIGVGLMSALVNVLALTGSLFMLQVYDRVIPSRSVPTLVGLGLLVLALYLLHGVFDLIRGRILTRIGAGLHGALAPRVYSALTQMPLRGKTSGDGLQPSRDLDQVRSFMSSLGPTALFDLPWIPLYVGICFLFHFSLGMLALAGAVFLIAITLATEMLSTGPAREAGRLSSEKNSQAEAGYRNAEVTRAMGMAPQLFERWNKANGAYLDASQRAGDVATNMGNISKVFRMFLQSAVLALGAYLVIRQEASGGVMIASSIMTTRALAPVELAIGNWRGFVAARQSWARLKSLLEFAPAQKEAMELPAPHQSLSVENASIAAPGSLRVLVEGATFALQRGNAVAVIGASGSGKSSLARALVGIWPAIRGTIRIDGAEINQWNPDLLGRHVGYLPQDVELFQGTVAENIARFEPGYDPKAVVAAAQAAGVHDALLKMADGYDTQLGEGGSLLSAGQRQRIALARALYKDPFLLVLDEPNASLDADGEAALSAAILAVRQRGGIAVIVSHRPNVLAAVDLVAVVVNGRLKAFGPKAEVLKKTVANPEAVVAAGKPPGRLEAVS